VCGVWRTFSILTWAKGRANEDAQLDTESQGNYVSEDCLTLNVIRPSGYEGTALPVGIVSPFILHSNFHIV
jgi:carboxylesterase type B